MMYSVFHGDKCLGKVNFKTETFGVITKEEREKIADEVRSQYQNRDLYNTGTIGDATVTVKMDAY